MLRVNSCLQHCCLSPCGNFLAGIVYDIAFIWSIASSPPRIIETYVGHTDPITSVTSSSSFILSSDYQSIQLRRFGVSPKVPVTADPESTQPTLPLIESTQPASPPTRSTDLQASKGVKPIEFDLPLIRPTQPKLLPIKSITLHAKDGIAISCDSIGVVRVWEISIGRIRTSFDTPAWGIEWGDAELIGDILTFCWLTGKGIHRWDNKRGIFNTVDIPHHYRAWDFRVSGKGSKIFLLDRSYIRAWSIDAGKLAAWRVNHASIPSLWMTQWPGFGSRTHEFWGGTFGARMHHPFR